MLLTDDLDLLADGTDEPIDVADPDPVDLQIDRKIICPFTVAVDTREQAPFRFLNIDPFSVVPLRTDLALATGDYSIVGFESRLTVERKSISDFLGSITAGRDRFEREFERMAEMEFSAVVVEGELSDVLKHSTGTTRVATDSILGTVDAWSIRYGVHWRFCVGGRRGAEICTLKLLHQWWRQEQKRVQERVESTSKVAT